MSNEDKAFLRKAIGWLVTGVVSLCGVIGALYTVEESDHDDVIKRLDKRIDELAMAEDECKSDREELREEFTDLRLKFAEMQGFISGKKLKYQKITADAVGSDEPSK